jgi:ribosomal protein L37AE/L43A
MTMPSFTDDPPPCPFCDRPGRWVGERRGQDHWQCEGCGLLFNTPANKDQPEDDWERTDEW